MRSYVDFICNELPEYKSVLLLNKEETFKLYNNVNVKIEVKIKILKKYDNAVEIKLVFDKYSDVSIYFISKHKSPYKVLYEINSKIEKIVNKYFDDNRTNEIIKEEILKRYENYKIDLSGLMSNDLFVKDPN